MELLNYYLQTFIPLTQITNMDHVTLTGDSKYFIYMEPFSPQIYGKKVSQLLRP